ncbi:MAG: hypothetical protein GSR80_001053 [Desulfurococcales archaeon]|nr:hypothetical protein [Desulfurococcales archaeon]
MHSFTHSLHGAPGPLGGSGGRPCASLQRLLASLTASRASSGLSRRQPPQTPSHPETRGLLLWQRRHSPMAGPFYAGPPHSLGFLTEAR